MNPEPDDRPSSAPPAATTPAARRRRRSPQRHVPTVINEPERRPFLFGLGGDLNHRERESLKERIALFGGIALAIVVAAILGWGLLYDQVIRPYQQRQANARPIAKIGSTTIETGFFQRYVRFNNQQLQNRITGLQQQASQLGNSKKNAAALQQVQAQISAAQSQQSTLPTDSLTQLVNGDIALQRYKKAGVTLKPSEVRKAINSVKRSTGGQVFFKRFLTASGLSYTEFQRLVTAQLLEQKISTKLAKTVKPFTTKVRASHILVKTKARAQQLLSQIRGGANFAALARKYSIDTGSAKKGGDLGFFARNTMVAPFDKAAFSMKPGELRIVHSRYGFHVVKVTGRQRAKLSASELANAKQTAFSTWLQRQQATIGLQKYVKPADLPGQNLVPTVNPLANQPLPQSLSTPAVVATPVTARPQATGQPKVSKPAKGKPSK